MTLNCTRCEGTGFLNIDQVSKTDVEKIETLYHLDVLRNYKKWIAENKGHDVQVCDCCGNGEEWYGEPGEHYTSDDPHGDRGPYSYNGGLCECN